MFCYNVKNSRPGPDGIYLVAELQSAAKPDPMPLTGEGIEGMRDAERLDAGSRLLVLENGGSEWILGEDGVWYEQKKAGGGGGGAGWDDPPTPEQVERAWLDAREDPVNVYHETRPRYFPEMLQAGENEICLLVRLYDGEDYNRSTFVWLEGEDSAAIVDTGYTDGSGSFVSLRTETVAPTREDAIGKISEAVLQCSYNELPSSESPYRERFAVFRIRANRPIKKYSPYWYDRAGDKAGYDAYSDDNIREIDANVPSASIVITYASTRAGTPSGRLSSLMFASFTVDTISSDGEYSVGTASAYFPQLISITRLDCQHITVNRLFANAQQLRGIPDIFGIASSCVYSLFEGCIRLRSAPRIDTGALSKATRTDRMFYGCRNMVMISQDVDLHLDESMRLDHMFDNCESLKYAPRILAGKATNADSLFAGCVNLTRVECKFSETSATTLNNVCTGCRNLICADIDAKVNTLNKAFSGCQSMRSVPRITDMTSATDLRYAFEGCENVVVTDDIDIPSAAYIDHMFYKCDGITWSPRIYARNAKNITGIFSYCNNMIKATIPNVSMSEDGVNMEQAFSGCGSVAEIVVDGDPITTSSLLRTFFGCSALRAIPAGIDTSKVTNFAYAASGCESLNDFPEWDFSSARQLQYMFQDVRGHNLRLTGLGKGGGSYPSSLDIGIYGAWNDKKPLAHLLLDPTVEGWTGAALNIQHCSLDHDAMIELFNSLPAITAAKNLTITGNPGADGLTAAEIAIATAKNWTVVGATNIIE